MMKGDKLASYVKENNSRCIQVNHLSKCPSSIVTRINPNFITSIQTSTPNPAKVYATEMKSLLRDDLTNGMREKSHSLVRRKEENDDIKRDYKEKVNGVLGQLQKNNITHSMVFQNRLNVQEERKKRFIDEDRLKNSKITQFIDKREDKDVFNHGNDLYQAYQRQEQLNSIQMIERQKWDKMRERLKDQADKHDAHNNRLAYEQYLSNQNKMEKQERMRQQQEYHSHLGSLVHEKKTRDSLDQKIAQAMRGPSKHNPITNPIEYHIQNPYFLKRMQDRSIS